MPLVWCSHGIRHNHLPAVSKTQSLLESSLLPKQQLLLHVSYPPVTLNSSLRNETHNQTAQITSVLPPADLLIWLKMEADPFRRATRIQKSVTLPRPDETCYWLTDSGQQLQLSDRIHRATKFKSSLLPSQCSEKKYCSSILKFRTDRKLHTSRI